VVQDYTELSPNIAHALSSSPQASNILCQHLLTTSLFQKDSKFPKYIPSLSHAHLQAPKVQLLALKLQHCQLPCIPAPSQASTLPAPKLSHHPPWPLPEAPITWLLHAPTTPVAPKLPHHQLQGLRCCQGFILDKPSMRPDDRPVPGMLQFYAVLHVVCNCC
jgi:hypothetical protein